MSNAPLAQLRPPLASSSYLHTCLKDAVGRTRADVACQCSLLRPGPPPVPGSRGSISCSRGSGATGDRFLPRNRLRMSCDSPAAPCVVSRHGPAWMSPLPLAAPAMGLSIISSRDRGSYFVGSVEGTPSPNAVTQALHI